MDKKTFFSLLDKYREGTTSAGERALVEEYYRRLEAMGTTRLSPKEETKLKERMYRRVVLGLEGDFKKSVIRRMPVWRKVAAAVAIFILLAAGGYILFYNKHTGPRQVAANSRPAKDLPPGRSTAILTLSSGKQIVLDSAANGTVTLQGNTKVIKLDSGQLAYNSTSSGKNEVLYNTISTPRGGQYQLVLADGSKVWLNSASSLRFPTAFTGNSREVELTGEGYFEIARNPSHPFRVKTDKQVVEVLGTHFNINSYSDEEAVRTTLLEGSVKVFVTGSEQAIVIKPGQQAVLTGDRKLSAGNNVDIAKIMAWKSGWFEFDQTELAAVMRQVSRWYDVDVVYEGKPATEKFGGRISKNLPLSSILQMLEANGVGFRLEGKKLIVRP